MNNVATNPEKEKSNILKTILSSPGMNEKFKIKFGVEPPKYHTVKPAD